LKEAPVPQRLILCLCALGALSGCATVQPWERARLADRCMLFDPDADQNAYTAHWQESREGSAGGTGVQSGGCGCK
jgi:hypothetical protein